MLPAAMTYVISPIASLIAVLNVQLGINGFGVSCRVVAKSWRRKKHALGLIAESTGI